MQGNLAESIKNLSAAPLSYSEAKEAAGNLLSFMELLIEIDKEHCVSRPNQCEMRP